MLANAAGVNFIIMQYLVKHMLGKFKIAASLKV